MLVAVAVGAFGLGLAVLSVVQNQRALPSKMQWSVDDHALLIQHHAEENELDEALVRAVVQAESSGNPRAKSSVGAKGLMQILPAAESDVLRVHGHDRGDLYNPDYNLQIGTAYLKMLMNRFENEEALAVAAYHMGASRVRKIQKAHPDLAPEKLIDRHANPTTRAYVRRVIKDYRAQKTRPATQ